MDESGFAVSPGDIIVGVGVVATFVAFFCDWLRRSSMSWRNDLDFLGSHPPLYSHPPLLGAAEAMLACCDRFIVGLVLGAGFVVVAWNTVEQVLSTMEQ